MTKQKNKKMKKNYTAAIFIFIIAIILIIAISQKRATITGKAVLSLQPSSNTVNLGSQLKLDILVAGVTNLAGAQISVSYNPALLKYDRTTEGTLLNSGNAQTLFLGTIDTSQPGVVKNIVILRTGSGVSGSGNIASIYFNAINSGYSPLTLGSVLLADINNNPISTSIISTNVTVIAPSPCGNSIIEPSEFCDDGNTNDGDGCSAGCLIELGYSCIGQPSVCVKCAFTNAYWSSSASLQGTNVSLTVEGNNCNAQLVDFVVMEQDVFPNPDDPASINPVSARFAGNKAATAWKAEWQCDVPIGNICAADDPEYYFIAFLNSDSRIRLQSSALLNVVSYVPLQLDRDNDGIPDLSDCNDFNTTIGFCKGCAVCSEDPSLDANRGKCIANACPIIKCPSIGICGGSGPTIGCRADESASYSATQPASCRVNGDIGYCLAMCDPISCTMDSSCTLDSDSDTIPDAQDRCPNSTFAQQNVYGYPLPIMNTFSYKLTTNLSYEDMEAVDDFKIGIENMATIWFKDHKIRLFDSRLNNTCKPLDFDRFIKIGKHFVELNPENLTGLNKSAIISFYNVTFVNPRILVDNKPCDECKILSHSNNTLVVNASHFSLYQVIEGPYCGDSLCNDVETCSSCSSDCGSCPSSGSSGSGGGGGGGGGSGGGGSGGGGISFVCNQDWQCTNWSLCVNGIQTRQCDFERVAQHTQDTECPRLDNPPGMQRSCEPMPIATCNDGIKNQNEQNTDCGGVCKPCAIKDVDYGAEDLSQTEDQSQKTESKAEAIAKPKVANYKQLVAFIFLALGLSFLLIILILRRRNAATLNTNPELSRYIQSMRMSGFRDKKIKEALIKEKWDRETIDSHLRLLKK